MSGISNDVSVAKLVAGVAGSFISLKFVQGTIGERAFMWVGGAALSYYATTPIAKWAGAPDAEGLIGFSIGLLGMTVVSKVYEVVAALDAKQMAQDVREFVIRKWRA